MRHLIDIINESVLNQNIKNVSNIMEITSLLDNIIKKGKNTTPEDLYESLNKFADWCVKKDLIKPIKFKGYRFDKYPGIYINYINATERKDQNGNKTGGFAIRIFNSELSESDNKVFIDDMLDPGVSGANTRGIMHPIARINVRHNINYYTKDYLNGVCTDPTISHFYYISDKNIVDIIGKWLKETPSIYGGQVDNDSTMNSIQSIQAFDKIKI